MKLKDYINNLNALVKLYPEALEMEVIYSSDDEGNNYQKISFAPSLCQVHSLADWNLEIVGNYAPEDAGIAREDCNAVIMN